MAQVDSNFKNEIAAHPGGERALNCFLCGSCTASCPVAEVTDEYNPRRMMRRILAGERGLLAEDEIWKCNQCFACVAHCPQDVRFANIIRAMREMAVAGGLRKADFAARVAEIEQEANRRKLSEVKDLLGKTGGGTV